MAKQRGRELLIKIGDGASPEVFSTLCGLTTTSITINNNEVDITTFTCATPSGQLWTEVMEGAKRLSISGNGIFEDSAAEQALNTAAMAANPLNSFQVIVPDLGTYEGSFIVSNVEFGGATEGGVTYSMSLGSSGIVTFTAA